MSNNQTKAVIEAAFREGYRSRDADAHPERIIDPLRFPTPVAPTEDEENAWLSSSARSLSLDEQ